ncbi:hypothetical protein SDJN02_09283, partial [Cucurbita argyrosperma subsp. argyrosperma]
MAGGMNRKISAASARAHTRRAEQSSSSPISSGFLSPFSPLFFRIFRRSLFLFQRDQWAVRVAHYTPWLTYWWYTQKWFPSSSIVGSNPNILSRQDKELQSKRIDRELCVCQGVGESNGIYGTGEHYDEDCASSHDGGGKIGNVPNEDVLLPLAMPLLGDGGNEKYSSEQVWKALVKYARNSGLNPGKRLSSYVTKLTNMTLESK